MQKTQIKKYQQKYLQQLIVKSNLKKIVKTLSKEKIKKINKIENFQNFRKLVKKRKNFLEYFYEKSKIISKNENVTIYEAVQILTNQKVAIKKLKKIPKEIKKIKNEIKILQLFRNNNFIIQLLEYFEDQKYYYLIFEYASQGDLVEIINKIELNNFQLRTVLFQILIALEQVHRKNVVHRDLKLDNILMDSKNRIKLIDFGISCIGFFPKDSQGTPNYISPEALNPSLQCTYKSDLWSFGVVAYILAFKQCPFYSQDKDELYDMIL